MSIDSGRFKVIFIGTGVSTALPNLLHVLNDSCNVCRDAMVAGSKNRRNNVSIAIVFSIEESGVSKDKCVMIDCGKTMRNACLSLLPLHGIKEVSSIILTHGHADAILGLDDVRDLQQSKLVSVIKATSSAEDNSAALKGFQIVGGEMPIFLHQETMDVVKRTFSYLTAPPEYLDESAFILSRRIALLKFNVIDPDSNFYASGLPVRSFPVYHGGEYVSLGFSIGKEGEFVYISDVKIIPESTMAYLRSIPQINTLVIDALNRTGIWPHMGLEEALAVVEELRPKVAYFTGMACDMGMHNEVEAELMIRAPHTHLAYDGLVLETFDIGSA